MIGLGSTVIGDDTKTKEPVNTAGDPPIICLAYPHPPIEVPRVRAWGCTWL